MAPVTNIRSPIDHLPGEIIFLIANYVGIENFNVIMILMQANKKLRRILLSWPKWTCLKLPRSLYKLSNENDKNIVGKLFHFIIPNLNVKLLRFDANNYGGFKDYHLRILSSQTPTLEYLNLRGSFKLTEACMI